MIYRRPTTNVEVQAPITFPRYLDQVPCPENFERIRFRTLAFHEHKALVMASGQYEGVKHLVVRITVHDSLHYLVLVYATPESDWTYYDKSFYSQSAWGAIPFRHLLGAKSAIEIIEMFFTE